jgi:hypothetical protein
MKKHVAVIRILGIGKIARLFVTSCIFLPRFAFRCYLSPNAFKIKIMEAQDDLALVPQKPKANTVSRLQVDHYGRAVVHEFVAGLAPNWFK